ncbi:hypothetical protein [Microbacterium sp. SS28]|uniref:hypothetical protein n=1 Tax=Microbacterium sp. SS28 TaxID=2919948 RepID=UPI001FA9DBF7|nr:hypothetical protein [Microbacterium sp. SS28]
MTVTLPIGPICAKCRFAMAYHPGICPECAQRRPLGYHSTVSSGLAVCASCAGEESVFACTSCGREDQPYSNRRCAGCVLAKRLTTLLTDPTTSRIHDRLQPLYDELAGAKRPQSVISWLLKPPATGNRLLGLMARGEMPISHDAFRGFPSDRSHTYLRDLLAGTGILPAYDASLERIERWLDDKLAPLDAEHAALISRYARWHVLHLLRQQSGGGAHISKGQADAARYKVTLGIRLANWAIEHGTTIATLTQPQLDLYFSDHPGGRAGQYGFISWLRRTGANRALRLTAPPSSLPIVDVSDEERWQQVDILLHDDTIRPYARIGGLFTLLFAQNLMDVCAMTTDQITVTDDGKVLVAFDTTPMGMPPILDTLIREHATRRVPSIASTSHGWLFPGRNPGRHLERENFRKELVAHGIHPARSRHAALFSLAGLLPAPVLADLIGIADKTATKWAMLAARDWSDYIAARTR